MSLNAEHKGEKMIDLSRVNSYSFTEKLGCAASLRIPGEMVSAAIDC